MTDKPHAVADAIVKMMDEVGYAQKKGKNEFHGYKYASIEGVLEKVHPALVKCGLVITQSEISHNIVADGNLMEAVYEFRLVHTSGECSEPIRHTGLASLRNTKGGYDDKALNKCHTAARKYFILGIFQIPTGLAEDPDAEEDKPHSKQEAPRREAPAATDTDKAKAWVKGAKEFLSNCISSSEIDDWYGQNAATIAKLQKGYAELFKEVMHAMAQQIAKAKRLAKARDELKAALSGEKQKQPGKSKAVAFRHGANLTGAS